jgi:hypothetical protein
MTTCWAEQVVFCNLTAIYGAVCVLSAPNWPSPRRANVEGLEIYVKVISPKSRADIRRVDNVRIVRRRDPASDHRQPNQG